MQAKIALRLTLKWHLTENTNFRLFAYFQEGYLSTQGRQKYYFCNVQINAQRIQCGEQIIEFGFRKLFNSTIVLLLGSHILNPELQFVVKSLIMVQSDKYFQHCIFHTVSSHMFNIFFLSSFSSFFFLQIKEGKFYLVRYVVGLLGSLVHLS